MRNLCLWHSSLISCIQIWFPENCLLKNSGLSSIISKNNNFVLHLTFFFFTMQGTVSQLPARHTRAKKGKPRVPDMLPISACV
ncbi:hypothetical protein LguiA_021020 [Lonicera macranthoides]